jgi:MOSC domain-containing protein YiiM
MATVASLHVSEASMRPMRSMDVVTLFPGRGIEGDRYFDTLATGTYCAFREPGRQLTVISGDSAAVAVRDLPGNRALTVGHLRRNVVVTGMTAAELAAAVGSTLRLGDCQVLVHRPCVPCMYNERLNRAPGLMEAAWDAGGVNCEILKGGELAVGDPVSVVPGSFAEGRADDGGKKAAFYKRPSLRTEDERASLASVPRHKPGVDRIVAAYAAVGAEDAIGVTAEEAARLRAAGATAGGDVQTRAVAAANAALAFALVGAVVGLLFSAVWAVMGARGAEL